MTTPAAFTGNGHLDAVRSDLAAFLSGFRDPSGAPARASAYITGSATSFFSPCIYQPAGHFFDQSGAYSTDVQVEIYAPALVSEFAEDADRALNRRVTTVLGEDAIYRFFLNHANGAGFYDKFPEIAELAWRWGTQVRRPGGVRVYLLTEADAGPSQLFRPGPGELGGPIELYNAGSGQVAAEPVKRDGGDGRGGMRVQTVSFRSPVREAREALEAFRARGDASWSLRDHDYYGAYLLSLAPGGRAWRRLLRPVFDNPTQSDWAVELLHAPADPAAGSPEADRERTEQEFIQSLGASDFQAAAGF
jgi:hypothetical protein